MSILCLVNMASAIHIFRGLTKHRTAGAFTALALVLVAFMLRSLRRRLRLSAGAVNPKGRSTLLTALRLSGRNLQHDQVVDAVMKPLESIVIRDGPTSVVHEHVVFKLGDTVQHCCGQIGTVVGIDEDGDLRVIKADSSSTAVWFASKCTKTFSIGDRVGYNGGDVAELIGFDADGDFIVRRADGSEAAWYRCNSTRLLSIGDRVHYCGGDVATVEGFDDEGDVEVVKTGGVKSVWFASKCIQGLGPLDKALPSEGP